MIYVISRNYLIYLVWFYIHVQYFFIFITFFKLVNLIKNNALEDIVYFTTSDIKYKICEDKGFGNQREYNVEYYSYSTLA